VLKTEHFDQDPGWEGLNNRIVLKHVPTVTQDFGYSPTRFAGKEKGEIGGRVQRSGKPAYYAAKIAVKTLNDPLTASGTFALTTTSGNSGVFFGWFNAQQSGGGGRPMNSLGLDLDGEKQGARLAIRLIAGTNRACGTFVTPFIPGKFRPTPLRHDGSRYAWTLRYDPDAGGGNGRFTFTLKCLAARPEELTLSPNLPERFKQEALRRFPHQTTFTVDIPPEVRKAGATFDHFGLMNAMKAGHSLTIYFADLQVDGQIPNLAHDPGWEGAGNRTSYPEREPVGAHDYGFSATNFAGGQPGEIGGVLWRGGPYSSYADRVGPLTLADRLEARGKIVLKTAAPDSDVFLGWFDSASKARPPTRAGSFLGVHIGGPTRIGHYFQPSLTTARGTRAQAAAGPVLTPGNVYDWSIVYDPPAEQGHGAIRVTLGKESVTLALKTGIQAQGGSFDRFGLFTPAIGGQMVRLYLDDLRYTSARR
jgi:hypothetical protein